MVVLPPVTSAVVVNGVAGVAALSPASGVRGSNAALPAAQDSTSVFLSGIAQRVLSELTRNPGLDIDTAFAQSLRDPVLGTTDDGALFSSTGLLQPFVPAPLLPQAPDAGSDAVDTQAGLDTLVSPPQTERTGAQGLLDLTQDDGGGDAVATDNEAAVTRSTAPAPQAVVATPTQSAAATAVTAPAVAELEPARVAPVAGVASNANDATVTTVGADAVSGNAIALNAAAVAAQPLANARVLDPYQQAALIAGLTSFGKEQAGFRAGAPDDGTAIPAAAAVTPVRGRRDDSTEAWLESRR
ncbi:MAG: hypothetical protein REI94_06785 [Moraxellaceae bacterium]|nr:hypothetical protein [Moraxellaceae bacterium]